MRSRTIFYQLVLVVLYSSSPVYSAEIDITKHLLEIMKCTTTHYEARSNKTMDFDEEAHNWAWNQCKDARESLLQEIPISLRPEWEAKLERVRTSMMEAIHSKDPGLPGYGLNPNEPVMIGGGDDGPRRTYRYFSRLRSPEGKPLHVHRIGSCCRFKTPNARIGNYAPLDRYQLTYDGRDSPIVVYVNIYDEGTVEPVKGFKFEDGT